MPDHSGYQKIDNSTAMARKTMTTRCPVVRRALLACAGPLTARSANVSASSRNGQIAIV